MTFLELNSKYNYSPDVQQQDTIAIYLKPYETYRQVFKIDLAQSRNDAENLKVSLIADNEEVSGLFYDVEVIRGLDKSMYAMVDFLIAKDYHSTCLRLSVGGVRTNPFVCSLDDVEFTSLVTYWHTENIDNLPFFETNYAPLQIRLPIYFKETITEEDSEEYVTSYNLRENYRTSRTKRVFKSVWKVDANNWLNIRIAKLSDCDFIYINSVRQSAAHFVYDETDNGGFVLSEWQTQPRPKDTIQIGLDSVIFVDDKTLDVSFQNNSTYEVKDFWTNYFHSLGISKENTIVKAYVNGEQTADYTYEQIMNGEYTYNFEQEPDAFTQQIKYYIEDLAGNRSNDAVLTLNFKREGKRYYDPNYYNQKYYA